MSDRRRLEDTRESITRKFSIQSLEIYITVGFYPNGQPGELFVTASKQGSTLAGLLDAWAIALSLLLQTGTPWGVIAQKFLHTRFDPGSEQYTSPVDGIVKNVSEVITDAGGEPDYDYLGPPHAPPPQAPLSS